jgi:hypothetical protein
LRATARLLAMAGDLTDDATLLTAALIANLAALAAAVPNSARPSSTPPRQPPPARQRST